LERSGKEFALHPRQTSSFSSSPVDGGAGTSTTFFFAVDDVAEEDEEKEMKLLQPFSLFHQRISSRPASFALKTR
jgi:hypothetical protein